jgi:hypothetical protein
MLGMKTLAHETPLHVDKNSSDGVDAAVSNSFLQLLKTQMSKHDLENGHVP